MNKCDAFVLPSRYETFGVVYIEALPVEACYRSFKWWSRGYNKSRFGILVQIDNIKKLSNVMEYIEKI